MTTPCPYRPPPAGAMPWPAAQHVSDAVLAWARSNLKYPMGTVVQAFVGGQPVIARLECHYHPPGGSVKPWGPHKGCTIYWPTAAIHPGVQMPTAGEEDLTPVAGDDPCIRAGTDYLDCSSGPNWGLVALSGGAALAVTSLFVLAMRHAGRAARRSRR